MKNIPLYLLFIIASLMMGCDNFVDVDLPSSLLTGPQVFEDPNTVRAALGNAYSKLRDKGILSGSGSGGGVAFGLYSDELLNYDLDGSAADNIYDNAVLASNPTVQDFWNESYHQIYCANAIIEGVSASKSLTDDQKNTFTGEALFIRAMVHFYLANIFGDVPYITSTNYEVNRKISRTAVVKAYENIIKDLTQAEALLPISYSSPERTIPNRAVATALLARVYLYNQNWAEAADRASALINDSRYNLTDPLDAVFLKGSASTIWQFKPISSKRNADESGTYIFNSAPPPSVSLANGFIAAFEPGDQRRQSWIGEVEDQGTVYYFAYKYKQNTTTASSLEYSVVLRLAEQFLIRAEARARQGDLAGAVEDLDKIRNKAGLDNTTAAGSTAILDAIARERRVEFFAEYGHRFFDLKRNGKSEILSASKPGWDHNDILWPIPETELLSNPALLPQNAGY